MWIISRCPYRGGWLVQVAVALGLGIAHDRESATMCWAGYNKLIGPYVRRCARAWADEQGPSTIWTWDTWRSYAESVLRERCPPWPG